MERLRKTAVYALPRPGVIRHRIAELRRETDVLKRLLSVAEYSTERLLPGQIASAVEHLRSGDYDQAGDCLYILRNEHGIPLMLGSDLDAGEVSHD